MIVYPKNWDEIGQPIQIKKIEKTILETIEAIGCNCLAFSGGLDSSLLLYFMYQVFSDVKTFTIGLSNSHPDVKYSIKVASQFTNVSHNVYIPTLKQRSEAKHKNDFAGDNAVRLFYKFVGTFTEEIISGDGIDEFMCGYYKHQESPSEEVYFDYMRRLQKEQLAPLNKNSGKIKVHLPYLDSKLILLLSQIPLTDKADINCRKKIMIQLAKGKVSDEVIGRRKYGFCDAFKDKEIENV